METQVFEKYDGNRVTESMIQEASQLFSAHYGVWGERAAQEVGRFAKTGAESVGSQRIGATLRIAKGHTYDSVREECGQITYPTIPNALTPGSPSTAKLLVTHPLAAGHAMTEMSVGLLS